MTEKEYYDQVDAEHSYVNELLNQLDSAYDDGYADGYKQAVDEFAEKLYNKSTDLKNFESDDYGMLHFEDVYEVAEQMKGGIHIES